MKNRQQRLKERSLLRRAVRKTSRLIHKANNIKPKYNPGEVVMNKIIICAYQELINDKPEFSYLFLAESQDELNSGKTMKLSQGTLQALQLDDSYLDKDCFVVREKALIKAGF